MRQYRVPGLAALAVLTTLSGAQAQEPPVGTWLSEGGEIHVRIAKCAAVYCGTIVWEKDSKERSLIGTQLLTDLKPDADGFRGNILNPRDGRTYTAKLKLKSPNELELSGCLLAVLCQSQIWTRVVEAPAKPPAPGGRS